MKLEKDYLYTKSHEWVKDLGNGKVQVGLTDHAQESLGDLVFINLPTVGDKVERGETFTDVESVKAVSDVYSPVDGTVIAVNEELADAPERINEDPYGAWIAEIELEMSDLSGLLSASDYEKAVDEE